MQVRINFPDEIAEKIRQLPDMDAFVSSLVKEALKNRVQEQPPSDANVSKWSKIVQRVQNDPVHLAGYSRQLKADMKEFRDNFQFEHDRNK